MQGNELPFNPSRSEEIQGLVNDMVVNGIPFHKTATLTSALGDTAVDLVPDVEVNNGKKVYLQGFMLNVNGAVAWGGGIANVKIQDKAGVDLMTDLIADLLANAVVMQDGANVTKEAAWIAGAGATAGRGLQVVADAAGTGSDLIVQVWGVIK